METMKDEDHKENKKKPQTEIERINRYHQSK